MFSLARAIHASADLRAFLRSPISNKEKKKAALTAAFESSVSATTTKFLQLLCEKRRENVLTEIITEFGTLYDERMGIERPTVTTAVALSEAQRASLEAKLAARLNKKVEPVYVVDVKVLGGVKIQIGDTIIDSSVTHQLETIRESMLTQFSN